MNLDQYGHKANLCNALAQLPSGNQTALMEGYSSNTKLQLTVLDLLILSILSGVKILVPIAFTTRLA